MVTPRPVRLPWPITTYHGARSNASLEAEATTLATVAADEFTMNAKGGIKGTLPPIVFQVANQNNIGVLAVVANATHAGFNPAIAEAVLTPGKAQTAAVKNLATLATQGYTGINLDFEAVPNTYRAQYTAFAQVLAASLHGEGKVLMLSLPAISVDDPTDPYTGAYDYAALGAIADTLQVMTYDENGPWGPPGPVAGLDWVTACIGYAESVAPASRISMGMPAYGYDWNLTAGTGTSVDYAAIPKLIAKTGAVPQWDAASSSPWFSYTASDASPHIVWYENAESITLKATYAAQAAAASVYVWVLGAENPAYWQAIMAGFTAAE